MKLIKLSEEHYIIVDDSEIKEGDWIGFPNLKKFVPVQYLGGDLTGGEKKITHSTQPLEWFGGEIIFLSEVKELLGVVDVEKKARNWSTRQTTRSTDYWRSMVSTYVEAYNECLEDNKEKKYTEEDLITFGIRVTSEAFSIIDGKGYVDMKKFDKILQCIQPKTEWEVEFIDEKLKLKS